MLLIGTVFTVVVCEMVLVPFVVYCLISPFLQDSKSISLTKTFGKNYFV